ncbi:DNA polymerase III subunit delta' [Azomonas macrocytogenes]|uniref:DNA polymerase III subunit delta' n=1 Tax=Azomonas macrocytogenes TaxID=69962 RepID=A0A839SY72_AZOMA|nr:DNA polymerase III subunit delta' [Azomonas macrocytogenes]MBB3101858.1 DNA polymerase-3 subunit delta' [Azomonas macrocytogenes]
MAEYSWQAGLWQRLAGRSQHAHAYLLHGPTGIGKRDLAERLMALLLCQQPQNHAPCGQCKACLLLAAGTHPDLFILEPEDVDKVIRVDQVRELVDFVAQTPQLGGRKVVLLEPAEAMNLNAANALLKSLEEPSGNTQLLLVSHQPSRLLPTIRSRCIQQACPLPRTGESLAWLATSLPELSVEERETLLQLAAGSPLLAFKLYRQDVLSMRAQVVDGIKKLHKQQQSPSQLAESWNTLPLVLLFDWFFEWSLLILRWQSNASEVGSQDMAKVIQYLAEKSSQARVIAMQEWLLAQRQKVLAKANLNKVLLLEALLVQWANLPVRN